MHLTIIKEKTNIINYSKQRLLFKGIFFWKIEVDLEGGKVKEANSGFESLIY